MRTAAEVFKTELPDLDSIEHCPTMAQLKDRASARGIPLIDVIRAEQDLFYKAIQNFKGIPVAIVKCRNPWIPVSSSTVAIGIKRFKPVFHCNISDDYKSKTKKDGAQW